MPISRRPFPPTRRDADKFGVAGRDQRDMERGRRADGIALILLGGRGGYGTTELAFPPRRLQSSTTAGGAVLVRRPFLGLRQHTAPFWPASAEYPFSFEAIPADSASGGGSGAILQRSRRCRRCPITHRPRTGCSCRTCHFSKRPGPLVIIDDDQALRRIDHNKGTAWKRPAPKVELCWTLDAATPIRNRPGPLLS